MTAPNVQVEPGGADALGAAFPTVDEARWRAEVDKVLDKAGALDAAALQAKFAKTLVTTTYDGLQIDPLYTAADVPDAPIGLPGQAPFVRGTEPLGHREHGWEVRQVVVAVGNAADVAARVRDELARGTTQIAFEFADAVVTADYLDACLEGVHLDLITVAVPSAAVPALAEVWERRAIKADARSAVLGFDPIGEWLRSGGAADRETTLKLATEWATAGTNTVALVADAALIHEAGGGEVAELGASMALGVELLRALADAGVDLDTAARQIEFRYAATPDQFLTIAKLRAARRMWQRVTSVAGASASAQRQRQHATTSAAAASRYDVWVNLLRATVEAFSAGVGGADSVTVLPHDELVTPGGTPLSQRMARNAQLVLIEESNVAQVVDMAAGSFYVERLTDTLAEAGWAFFQTLERAGGIIAAAEAGTLQDEIDRVATARASAVAKRKHPLTGVSEFPDITEPALAPAAASAPSDGSIRAVVPRRYSDALEAQRGRADARALDGRGRPQVFLATLGTPAVHTARATFAKNLFEVGGIEAIVPEGFETPDEAAAAFTASGARLACICSSDDRYKEQAVAVAHALIATSSPPARLFVAGKPADITDELTAAGVDEFIVAGLDIVDFLTRTHDLLDTL